MPEGDEKIFPSCQMMDNLKPLKLFIGNSDKKKTQLT